MGVCAGADKCWVGRGRKGKTGPCAVSCLLWETLVRLTYGTRKKTRGREDGRTGIVARDRGSLESVSKENEEKRSKGEGWKVSNEESQRETSQC